MTEKEGEERCHSRMRALRKKRWKKRTVERAEGGRVELHVHGQVVILQRESAKVVRGRQEREVRDQCRQRRERQVLIELSFLTFPRTDVKSQLGRQKSAARNAREGEGLLTESRRLQIPSQQTVEILFDIPVIEIACRKRESIGMSQS